ncbi:hypothetical protein [Nocardia africana]
MTATADRVSVTQRPTTIQQVEAMAAASGMTKSDVFNVGVDVLHFVWSVLRNGGEIGVKFADETAFNPVVMLIPGLDGPSADAREA